MTEFSKAQEPRPGDILLFTKPRRGRDYLIKWVTHSPYYHVALYAGEGKIIEARPPVVARHDLAGREEGMVVVPAPGGLGKEALAHAEAHLGDQFDKDDMFVILLDHLIMNLHIKYDPKGKFTCAELIAKVFDEAGLKLFPEKDLDEVVPGDFARFLPEGAGLPSDAAQLAKGN